MSEERFSIVKQVNEAAERFIKEGVNPDPVVLAIGHDSYTKAAIRKALVEAAVDDIQRSLEYKKLVIELLAKLGEDESFQSNLRGALGETIAWSIVDRLQDPSY